MNKLKKKKNLFRISNIYFFLYFLVGIFICKDFGIGYDEQFSRNNGFVTGNYILEKFLDKESYNSYFNKVTSNKFSEKIIKKSPPTLHEHSEKAYGVVFDLPLAAIETVFNITDSRTYFLTRHYINYILFFLSIIFFHKILKLRFGNTLAFLGVIFLSLNPRIFANAFYNTKDIFFLSLSIFSLYFGYLAIVKSKMKYLIYLSFFGALMTQTRIIGVIYFAFPMLLIFFKDIFIMKKFYISKKILLSSLLFIVFLYLFWPFLWENPINNIIYTLKFFSNHPWNLEVFFKGAYYLKNNLPSDYLISYLIFTNPILLIFFFTFGLITKIGLVLKKNIELVDLLFLLLLFFPITTVIILKPTLLDGWRHFYFLLPIMIIISLYGFLLLRNNKILTNLIFVIIIIYHVFINVKLHPFQYVYFNTLYKVNSIKYFDKDYWALSNKQLLEFLLKNYNENIYYDSAWTNIDLSKQIFFEKEKQRIKNVNSLKDFKGNYFLIINYRFRNDYNKYNKIIKKKIYEIKVNNEIISGVYLATR